MKTLSKKGALIRYILGTLLLGFGLFRFDGINGNEFGLAISAFSLIPFYFAITCKCLVGKDGESNE
jgi:hypothetical protein